MFKTKFFKLSLLLFLGLNLIFYLFIIQFNNVIPFNAEKYYYSSHHWLEDPRFTGGNFSLFNALGVWDAQWYLRIADDGYPPKVVFDKYLHQPVFMGALTYAFFPLYPMLLAFFNVIFRDIELTAYVLTWLLMLSNFFSLYYVVTKLFSKDIAVRTIFLLFLFPFSVFYRSYYTEGLFLLLLIWFSYFLIKKQWLLSTIFAALMFVTRPNGIFLGAILIVSLFFAVRKHKLPWFKAALLLMISVVPLLAWFYWCFYLTGDPFYWHTVQAIWYKSPSIFHTLVQNISSVAGFFDYPIHDQRQSKIDVLMMVVTFVLLLFSRKYFKEYPQLWWISLFIWLVPLLVRDLMSFSRYQIISFPLFIFLAAHMNRWVFYALCVIFLAFLLYTSIYLVNWHWVG